MTILYAASIQDDVMTFYRENMTSSAVTGDWSDTNNTSDIFGNVTSNDTAADKVMRSRVSIQYGFACGAVPLFILNCIPLFLHLCCKPRELDTPVPLQRSFVFGQNLALVALMIGFHPPTTCSEVIRTSLLLTSHNVLALTLLTLAICSHIAIYRPSMYPNFASSPWILVSIGVTWIGSVVLGHVHYLVTVIIGVHNEEEEDFCNRVASRTGIAVSVSLAIAIMSIIICVVIFRSINKSPIDENPNSLELGIAEQLGNNNIDYADLEDEQVVNIISFSMHRYRERLRIEAIRVRRLLVILLIGYIIGWILYLVVMETVYYGNVDLVVSVILVLVSEMMILYGNFYGSYCLCLLNGRCHECCVSMNSIY